MGMWGPGPALRGRWGTDFTPFHGSEKVSSAMHIAHGLKFNIKADIETEKDIEAQRETERDRKSDRETERVIEK